MFLIITGPLRSGTTMVAHEISRFIGAKIRPEITPLSDLLRLTGKWRLNESDERYSSWINLNEIDRLLYEMVGNHFLDGGHHNSAIHVAKDPELLENPFELLNFVKVLDCPLVLVVRDPLDVLASCWEVQRKQTFGHTKSYYLKKVIRSFNGAIQILLDLNHRDGIFLFRYEDFVNNPKNELDRLHKSISEGRALVPIRNHSDDARTSTALASSNPYHTNLRGTPPQSTQIGKYKSRLSLLERHYIVKTLSVARETLSYRIENYNEILAFLGGASVLFQSFVYFVLFNLRQLGKKTP